jgi:hypothetical protein
VLRIAATTDNLPQLRVGNWGEKTLRLKKKKLNFDMQDATPGMQ